MNAREFWSSFGSERHVVVVFAHGTAVMLEQPEARASEVARALLAELGPVRVGSEAADFTTLAVSGPHGRTVGSLVTSYRDEIATWVAAEATADADDALAVGLHGRSMRDADARELDVVMVDARVPRSREGLVAAMAAGYVPELLPFFGKTRDPRCAVLSQWWPSPFVVDGERYATAEHFMMAEKARIFGDETRRRQILASYDPATAKQLGRTVVDFDEATWSARRDAIVLAGNMAKFGQDDGLRALLFATWPAIPVEASPTDRTWGVGLGESDPGVLDPRAWQGDNRLGFALAETRRQLMREASGG